MIRTAFCLCNMIKEMSRKQLDLKRLSKTSCLLIMSGMGKNSTSKEVLRRSLDEQHTDGGWIGIVDTMWNAKFLSLVDSERFSDNIGKAHSYLKKSQNSEQMWGRSPRDISRIPVSALYCWLFPDQTDGGLLSRVEALWQSELNSIVYKASYTLMAFSVSKYHPQDSQLIAQTCRWLSQNQRQDGGFAPWLDHPAESNVFCTSLAMIAGSMYAEHFSPNYFTNGLTWLRKTQLPSGIWPFHEIEDGASWGLYALSVLETFRHD